MPEAHGRVLALTSARRPSPRTPGVSGLPSCLSQVPSLRPRPWGWTGLRSRLSSGFEFFRPALALPAEGLWVPSPGTNSALVWGQHPASLGGELRENFGQVGGGGRGCPTLLGSGGGGSPRLQPPTSSSLSKSNLTFSLPVSYPRVHVLPDIPLLYPKPTAPRHTAGGVQEKEQG